MATKMNLPDYLITHGILKRAAAERMARKIEEEFAKRAEAYAERMSEIVSDAIDPSVNVSWMRGSPDLPKYVRGLEVRAEAAESELDKCWVMLVEEMRKCHKLECDGAFSLDRDPMAFQPVLAALQDGSISTGKARELLREWLAGAELKHATDVDPESATARAEAAEAKCAELRQLLADLSKQVVDMPPAYKARFNALLQNARRMRGKRWKSK
jgi:hypothetical protein